MKDYLVPECPCPYCGKVYNGCFVQDQPDMSAPRPGDVSICTNCASPLIFDDELLLREPSREELDEIYKIPGIQQAILKMAVGFLAEGPEQ